MRQHFVCRVLSHIWHGIRLLSFFVTRCQTFFDIPITNGALVAFQLIVLSSLAQRSAAAIASHISSCASFRYSS